MKVIVLLAGGLGLLGFFLPFYSVELDGQQVKGSAYQMFLGKGDARLQYQRSWGCTPTQDLDHGDFICEQNGASAPRTLVPWYFLSMLTFLTSGIVSIWKKRMSGTAGVATLSGSMFAIGCWLHEINEGTQHFTQPLVGATLLGISGVLALAPAIAVLYWREPDPVPLFKIRLPMARLIRR